MPIVLFLWFTASLVLSGGPIVISDGDVEALIEAIEDANDDCGIGDPVTIQLAANGTYTLTDDYEDFNGPTGLPAVRCTLTIVGNNATIERDTEADDFRLLALDGDGDLHLFNLILTNGVISGDGGAILNGSGSLSLTSVTVSNNVGTRGGGMFSNMGR